MATVFKRRFGTKYTAAWVDPATGARPERSTRTSDKRLAQRIVQQWEDEAIARSAGLVDTHAETIAQEEARPLELHLMAYLRFLEGKGTGQKQVALVETRLWRIITLARAERISHLTASAALAALQGLRQPAEGTGISNQTATHIVRTIKGFTKWLVRDRRSGADLLAHLTTFNAEADRRRVRRDLSPEELDRLIAVAEVTPTVTVMKPERDAERNLRLVPLHLHFPERAWAYRVGAGTGFRASEVGSLTVESFDLDTNPATIVVEAGYSKRRRRDVQPIARALADQLRPWLATKPRGVPVCPLPNGKAALLLRADLDAARAAWLAEARTPAERAEREESDFLRYADSAGRVADFHSLRATYISRVVETGCNLKEAMELARHSDPRLTLKTYARVRLHDLSAVLERLPGATVRPGSRASA